MKTIKIYTVLLCLLVCTGNTFGQKKNKKVMQSLAYKTGNPADWAANLDAVIAAPKNRKILLENDKVLVTGRYQAKYKKMALLSIYKWFIFVI